MECMQVQDNRSVGEMEEWTSSDYNAVYFESEDFVDSEDDFFFSEINDGDYFGDTEDDGSDEVDYWFFNA